MKMDFLKKHGWWIAIVVIIGGIVVSGMNTIPTQDEQVKAAWSEVQNQYQRRMDLIPNLVNTVKGASNFEQSTLVEVINARAAATKVTISSDIINNPAAMKQFEQVQGTLGSALSHLMAVSENYPDLKSNQQYQTLMSQLEGTENRIAIARRDYISTVQAYNITVRTFPGMIWAGFYHAGPKAEFEATQGADQAPAVKF
jgi:LemA protein